MKFKFYYLIVLGAFLFLTGCVDRSFDEPPFPGEIDLMIPEDMIISIEDLIALRPAGENFHEVAENKYLRTVITGDDKSGNIYKTLVLQDETAGIAILLDDVEIWNRYFVGKEVYVNLENIWLGDFNNLPQIGFEPVGGSMARIPAELIETVLLVGNTVGAPAPVSTSISQINPKMLNTLITLKDVQFTTGSVSETYADAVTPLSINHYLEDCNGNEIIVRTSGFSSFAGDITPSGKGTVTALLGIFGSDYQLILRDLDDVKLEGERCNAGSGGGPVDVDPSKVVSIESILDRRVSGVETLLGSDTYIKGAVVSSDETGNFYKSLTIEDESGAVAILVDATNLTSSYGLGSIAYVHLQDLFISDYNGLPQLGYAPSTSNVKRIPEGLLSSVVLASNESNNLSPTVVGLGELSEEYLNRYISIEDLEIEDGAIGSRFADGDNQQSVNHTLQDCDGNTILLRTSGFADFANDVVPSGNGSIKGVLQVFGSDYQLILNFPEDARFSDTRCDGNGGGGNNNTSIDFEGQIDFDPVSIDGWTNVAVQGERIWEKRSFDGNGFAEVKAYQDTSPVTEAWLISSEIDTEATGTLSFQSANAFYAHQGLSLWYSTDFSGDINTATWNELSATLADANSGDYNWVNSGDIDLSSLGSIVIGFKYEGTSGGNTTTYRLDNISIR